MKEVAKNLGLLGSWDDLKTILDLDFMDGLYRICEHEKIMGIIALISANTCTYMYTCNYTCAHTCVYVCEYTYMYVYIYKCVCVYTCRCVCAFSEEVVQYFPQIFQRVCDLKEKNISLA